jgi:hypothetical protein
MLTTLVKQVNESVSDLFLRRRKADLSLSISIQPNKGEAIRNLETGELRLKESMPTLKVKSLSLSKNEISFIVPAIRFNDVNLAGEGRILDIEVELPNGKVKLEAVGEHYERVGKRTSLAEYLVEARIVYINPLEEVIYKNYLRHGDKLEEAKGESFVFGTTER